MKANNNGAVQQFVMMVAAGVTVALVVEYAKRRLFESEKGNVDNVGKFSNGYGW